MDVLLTFTGFHDPYFKGLIDQEDQPGPILSLLATRSFDHIFLFDTPSTRCKKGGVPISLFPHPSFAAPGSEAG